MNSMTTLGAKTILLAIRDNSESAIDTLELKVTQKKKPHSHITYLRGFFFVHCEIIFIWFKYNNEVWTGQWEKRNLIFCRQVVPCIVNYILNSVDGLFIWDIEFILYANIFIKEIPVLEEAIGIIDELKSCRKRFVVVHDVTVLSEDFLSCVDCPMKPQRQKAHKKSAKSKKKSWDLALDL